MDFSNEELRRQLRASQAEHRAAMRPWRDALARIFRADGPGGAGERLITDQKAQLLGVPVPGRRELFRIGGLAIAGAAVLAACGSDDDDDAGGPSTTDGSSSTTEGAMVTDMDRKLLRTASSLEVLAVATYDTAIASGLVTTKAIVDAASLFRDQHDEHAKQLQSATEDAGGEPYTEPNAFVKANVVDPGIAALTNENGVVLFALTLEQAAASTYVFAASALSSPALRQAIMAIGGVEARHAAILSGVASPAKPQVPAAFFPTTDRIPDEAIVS